MNLDPRFKAAMMDAPRARQMLNDLHQQILNTQDRRLQSDLLAKYVALVTSGRLATNPASKTESAATVVQMLTSMQKAAHDQAMAIINNLRA